jgi:hypothetical protein
MHEALNINQLGVGFKRRQLFNVYVGAKNVAMTP